MNQQELHLLQHTRGLDQHGRGAGYRNHIACEPGSIDHALCIELTERGWMQCNGSKPAIYGDLVFFQVTPMGMTMIQEHSPPPPKLTRGQKRYREWLNSGAADIGLSFGKWLLRSGEMAGRNG